jgi:hypothetical protein
MRFVVGNNAQELDHLGRSHSARLKVVAVHGKPTEEFRVPSWIHSFHMLERAREFNCLEKDVGLMYLKKKMFSRAT